MVNYIELFFCNYKKFIEYKFKDNEENFLVFIVLFKYSQTLSLLLEFNDLRQSLNLLSISLSRFNYTTSPQWVRKLI